MENKTVVYNFAGKQTDNSQVYVDGNGPGWYAAHKAVDGIYDPGEIGQNQYYSLVALLPATDAAWLSIDLEVVFCVEAVKIYTQRLEGKSSSWLPSAVNWL